MLKRTVSGAVYVAIIVGFFFLRTVDYRLFDIFIWFLSFMGAFEIARAVKPFSVKGEMIFAIIFGITFIPVFVLFDYLFKGLGYIAGLDFIALFCLIIAIYSIFGNYKLKTFGISILPIIYPALLLLSMVITNGFEGQKGLIALILIFVISPCADVFAYLVGMTYGKIKKGNVKKLCPSLSPNKTWAGAIGGVIGGGIGGLIIYFIFKGQANILAVFSPIAYFIIAGVLGSVLTELGDLFESLIKRKVGIKDMGRIMPGHGGVMDRIDGTLFCSVLICFMFLFI